MLRLTPAAWPRSALVLLALAGNGCGERLTDAECERVLSHYVEVLSRAEKPPPSPAEIQARQERALELVHARPELDFAACPERMRRRHLDCALRAGTADDLEQCLAL